MSSKPRGPGDNSELFVDPGIAKDFFDKGPVAQRPQFDRVAASRFYSGVRSQGNDGPARQIALSKLLERARANAALSHGAYRVLERIVFNARGVWRYSVEPQWSVAHWCGFCGPKNLHRFISELADLGFIVRIDMPRRGGGHPFPIFAPVCIPADRSGLGTALIGRDAEKKRPQSSKRNSEPLEDDLNASSLSYAMPQIYGQTVDRKTVEREDKIMSASQSEDRRPCEEFKDKGGQGPTCAATVGTQRNVGPALSVDEVERLRALANAAREVGAQVPHPRDWVPDDRIYETAVHLGDLDLEKVAEGKWRGPPDDVDVCLREFEAFRQYNCRRVDEGHAPADKHFVWERWIEFRLEKGIWGQG